MGTSVSHPSPRGNSPGAPEWKEAKDSIKEGANPRQVAQGILGGFGSEYGADAQAVIIDAGVRKVAAVLETQLAASTVRGEAAVITFISQARKELALSQTNSFFAELALSAASRALMQGGDSAEKSFAAGFASKVIDYVVSRDLPSTIGSKGITNLESLDRLLAGVSTNFEERAQASRLTDSIQILESILEIPRRRDNE